MLLDISDSSQTYSGRVFSKGLSFCGFKFPRKAKVRYFAKYCIVHQYISCCQILQEYIIIQINFKTIYLYHVFIFGSPIISNSTAVLTEVLSLIAHYINTRENLQ